MDRIVQYIMSVITAGIICGIINGLFSKKSAYCYLVRMLCGLFMIITVIHPVAGVSIPDYSRHIELFQLESTDYIESGKLQASEEMRVFIKDETEAYIQKKASSVGANISVNLLFSETEPYIPVAADIYGTCTPYAKSILTDYISLELGIPKENQKWKFNP